MGLVSIRERNKRMKIAVERIYQYLHAINKETEAIIQEYKEIGEGINYFTTSEFIEVQNESLDIINYCATLENPPKKYPEFKKLFEKFKIINNARFPDK